MKLTNRTNPQARNYQCNLCKSILTHKQMYDDNICEDCFDKEIIEENKELLNEN